ncbi:MULTISPECIES: HlyD family type I secretion periplasmic adaptor subunit [Bradyrhizobium]|uniref:HlyD family type I secretion periplasmic adaptor subunit n=1 Tax=Bradyrhizobium TaxID=374 RepID=UPI0027D74C18|nr:HlyD family type I secretion periplasmic adaptor subunit [Bradyrhizobium sp. TM233]GMO63413.1 HlyD family type I secretion periplasmic adaptor subunit [Bradyrhizobium ottawaense]GMO94592.1 HlyD family type I secretion periplasmic adaptor subunit [Bradyrhizobium ottawaense]GMP10899.1 HlyD family type I secretion periplasmic adaptor subunit [Bradyrhizobium ottawaense]GMP20617.1 HlyD family type I secretion periplasmic adaptor subunit [Bradyrhizobium ottawaense]
MSSADVIERKSRTFWRRQREAREFLPAALEILETPASPVGRAVGLTIILFFALAIGWATFGHVDIIATATGKVVPTGRTKTIQPLEAGIVSAIHVHDGDRVTAGQVLVELDRTVTQAERKRVRQDLVASLLDVARLSALRRSFANLATPHDIEEPAGASEVEIARARSAMLAQAAEQQAKLASVVQQIDQKRAEAQSVTAAIAKIDATLPLLEETLTIRKKAMDIQYGNRIAWIDAQTRLIDQQNERIVQERKLVEIEAARRALEQQLAQTRSGFERQVLSDLSDAQKKADEFRQDTIKAQQKTDEQLLRAPIDGTVQQLAIHTVGGVVTPAQQLMMIVPRGSSIEVEAMISNRDIGFVEHGQDAEIKIDTFNFTRYGLLHGKVISVSRDAIIKDKPTGGPGSLKQGGALAESSEPVGRELLYAARVSLDGTQMQVEAKMVNLAPGMAVTVEIKTGRRRIVEYALSPLLRYKQESLRER